MCIEQGCSYLQWVRGLGVQLTVGTLGEGGPADFHVNTYMYWASLHGSNHSTLHMRIPSRRKRMATVPYYICCKFLLSPFVPCFHLGCRICLRGPKSTLKSVLSSKNGRL